MYVSLCYPVCWDPEWHGGYIYEDSDRQARCERGQSVPGPDRVFHTLVLACNGEDKTAVLITSCHHVYASTSVNPSSHLLKNLQSTSYFDLWGDGPNTWD